MLGLSRLLFIVILAIHQKNRQKEHVPKNLDHLSVAVIVPAYNEEKVVNQTIASLLSCQHPKQFEIIVVDDGSKDGTYSTVRSLYGDDERVHIYKIENSGKSGALNFGITKTQADIIVVLDADTVFTKNTIMNLVRHFENVKVGAVAGNAKVGNRLNLMTRWQALEYIVSQNLDRRAFVVLNCITVVPGAVGAWRTSLVKQVGGFSSDTLAEDADLTIEIGKLGYKILYEENAIALTEAPDSVKTFVRQRYRWMFGTFQVGWKHKKILFNPKYGWLGTFALPNIFIYQILFPLISPIMDLMMIVSIITAILDKIAHPVSFSNDSLQVILFYYAIFLFVDYIASYIAFTLE